MKERILLLLLAISSILVGCSESDSIESGNETLSEIPILLNAAGSFDAGIAASQSAPATRASVDSIPELGKVGIYCMAGRKTNVIGSDLAADPNWGVELDHGAGYATTTNGIYWNNLKCSVDPATGLISVDETVDGVEQDYIWYYPITSWYAYDFYGYHPYNKDSVKCKLKEITPTRHQVVADVIIDGKTDLLWGRSEIKDPEKNENNKYAYSARYFRNASETAAKMKFEHCLAQFRFFIQPREKNETENSNLHNFETLAVKEITMHDVADRLTLLIADSDPNEQGEVGVVERVPGAALSNFTLFDVNGDSIAKNPVPFSVDGNVAQKTQVGDCIMVCPNDTAYYMSMVICDKDKPENVYRSEKLMTIKLNGNKPFEAGQRYNIYITATGVTEINLVTEVEPWEDYNASQDDDENLNFDID